MVGSFVGKLNAKSNYRIRTMKYKKPSIIGLGITVISFAVLLFWCSSSNYLSLIPVFLAGTGMAGLFTT